MTFICPECKENIEAKDVNVEANLAKCMACNSIFKATDLFDSSVYDRLLLPPKYSKVTARAIGENTYEWVHKRTLVMEDYATFIGHVFILVFVIAMNVFVNSTDGPIEVVAIATSPILLVDIYAFLLTLSNMMETQTLTISPTELSINRKTFLRPIQVTVPIDDIEEVEIEVVDRKKTKLYMTEAKTTIDVPHKNMVDVPMLTTKNYERIVFFEDRSRETKEWAVNCLAELI